MATCSIADCSRVVASRGWCSTHYGRWWRHGDPLKMVNRWNVGACSVDGCERPAKARGYCTAHWRRVHLYGDPHFAYRDRMHNSHCSVIGCDRPYQGRGFCRLHLERVYMHGSPTLADDLVVQQRGACAICKRPARGRGHEARLHLDHDHVTGRIRGMLCGPCNKALGLLGDDPVNLRAALDYLEAPALHGYLPDNRYAQRAKRRREALA